MVSVGRFLKDSGQDSRRMRGFVRQFQVWEGRRAPLADSTPSDRVNALYFIGFVVVVFGSVLFCFPGF